MAAVMAAHFAEKQGYYSSGNEISTGWHTLTEAKRVCAADCRIVGFCFQGDTSNHQKVWVFFKSQGCSFGAALDWRTFEKELPLPPELQDDIYIVKAKVQLQEHQGSYYGAGNDVAAGKFTLAEAKRKCLDDPYCEGFCFNGDASGGQNVHCYFKSGNTGCGDGAGWTRFSKPSFSSPPQRHVHIDAAQPEWSMGSISCEQEAESCGAGYARRTEADLGGGLYISIKAFDCVPADCLAECKHVVESMLRDIPLHIKQRMVQNQVHVGVMGKNQMTLDLPPYDWLKSGQSGDGRGWNQTRGLGGTLHCPCSSIAEENLMMHPDDCYSNESIMVHEFAHTVMRCGFDQALLDKVQQAYDWCKARPSQFDGSQYWMSNTDEFWAELTQGWFHGSNRTDVNNGIVTRDMVRKQVPLMAQLFAEVYGNNPWVYTDDCPHPEKWH